MLSDIREIFRLYGGWRAFRSSSYVLAGLIISLALWRDALSGIWAKTVASYLPPLLGFSFAALAIMTAIGDERFRAKMAKIDVIHEGESDLTTITATFCWFIFVQIAAVMSAIIFAATPIPFFCERTSDPRVCLAIVETGNDAFGFLGNFLLSYSLVLIISAVSQMMKVFRLYLKSVS